MTAVPGRAAASRRRPWVTAVLAILGATSVSVLVVAACVFFGSPGRRFAPPPSDRFVVLLSPRSVVVERWRDPDVAVDLLLDPGDPVDADGLAPPSPAGPRRRDLSVVPPTVVAPPPRPKTSLLLTTEASTFHVVVDAPPGAPWVDGTVDGKPLGLVHHAASTRVVAHGVTIHLSPAEVLRSEDR